MSDFHKLTPDNIMMFAMKHYDNPSCVDDKEFLDDMKRFKYLKRLFRKYDTSKVLKIRLILNLKSKKIKEIGSQLNLEKQQKVKIEISEQQKKALV